jgi:hypothetical protein
MKFHKQNLIIGLAITLTISLVYNLKFFYEKYKANYEKKEDMMRKEMVARTVDSIMKVNKK